MLKVLNKKFLKFILVGISNTIVGLSVIYLCLYAFGVPYWLSSLIGYVIGFCNGYILNKKFVFNSNKKVSKTIWKFVVVFVFSYILSYYLSFIFVDFFLEITTGILSAFISRKDLIVIVGAAIYTLVNYIGNSIFTFRE